MNEFIFGDLYTPAQRLKHLQEKWYGVQHHCDLNPFTPQAGDEPLLTVTIGLPKTIKRVECVISEPRPVVLSLEPMGIEWDALNWQYLKKWQTRLPAQRDGTLVRYQIFAYPAEGEVIAAEDGGTFSYLVGNPAMPEWTKSAIIYQVFPDRFHPGRGQTWKQSQNLAEIWGGTLQGIVQNIDYIADMGFNCIWLNPFFPDSTHHGYHATDYFSVNPRLGTEEDLIELRDKAKARGLRLILDFVANHWGSRHVTFQHALTNRNSPYYDWYYWVNWPDDYLAFFGVKELPKLNVDHPGVRQYMFEAVRHWLKFGFEGIRLDYALGPTHDFWTAFRQVVKQFNPEAWIFGEAVGMPTTNLSYRGRFDGCLDFMLLQALRDTFAFHTMSIEGFDAFLNYHEAYFPADFSRPSFLDNHDMNRFLWLAQGDKRKLKLAALCQFTLGGPPVVYYGTEVGVYQERDVTRPDGRQILEESRMKMLWGDEQDSDLREYYRWLIHLRRNNPVLWQGTRRTVQVSDKTGLYVYVRENGREKMVVALNLSDRPQTIQAEGITLHLDPWSGKIQ